MTSVLLRGIALGVQAIPPIPTHFSIVCLSSHIRALCLDHSMDWDAIWQVHWWAPVTHCVRWSPWLPGEGEIRGSNPQAKRTIANCCCHLAYTREERFRLLPNYFDPCWPVQQYTVWVKKSIPLRFSDIFSQTGIFSPNFTHLLYVPIYVRVQFLFNYLQLWRSHAILSVTTQRIFTFH